MNAKDFDEIVTARMDWCRQTLCAKGDEYARGGDRLWNFKVAGRKLNCHPAQALAGMMVKHTVSVDDIIDGLSRGIVPPKELVAEKIGDSIDYLLLLEGLIEEARREVPEVDDTLYEGSSTESWPTAASEQGTRRREQAATSAQRRRAMDALASARGYTIPPIDDGDDWSGGKGQCSLEGESHIVAEKVRAFGEQLAAKLNNTVLCHGCGRRWPLGSEQGRSVSDTGRCIVCRADEDRATYTVPPPQDGDDDPIVHIVPDRTSRSGEVEASDWRPCPND